MKTRMFFLAILSFVFTLNVISQETKELKVSSFSKVKFEGAAHWVLIQSETEKVEIETNNSEIFNYVEVDNRGDQLVINTTEKSKDITKLFKSVTIRVYFKSVDDIKLSGVGSVIMKNNTSAQNVTATLRGTGNMTIAVDCKEFIGNMHGTGAMEVSGSTKESIVKVEGVGTYDGYKLESETTNVTVSGVGSAGVFASESLTATINGVGSIRYMGNPLNKNLNSNGLGSIKEAKP